MKTPEDEVVALPVNWRNTPTLHSLSDSLGLRSPDEDSAANGLSMAVKATRCFSLPKEVWVLLLILDFAENDILRGVHSSVGSDSSILGSWKQSACTGFWKGD